MNELIRLSIGRPVGVWVGILLVTLFGLLSVAGLPIQLTPDVTVPRVSVTTNWPGASPGEVERDIIEVQEEALRGIPGMKRMEASAQAGRSEINLEFRVGQDMSEALLRVSNRLSQVPAYPENVREPLISSGDTSGPPLAVLVIHSTDEERRPVAGWRTWVRDSVASRYERIPGVGTVRVFGGQDRVVNIDFDPSQLATHGVAPRQVAAALRTSNRDLSAGDYSVGSKRWEVRVLGESNAPEALEELVLYANGRGSLRLGDLAEARWGLRKRSNFVLQNGSEAIALLFWRESGFNVLEVTREIHDLTRELGAGPLADRGLQIEVVADQVRYIEGALSLVRQNIVIGGLLATLVLLAFLGTLRPALVVATAIPVSIFATILCMKILGRSVNVVSLAGMAFAVGMLIDAAIVVLENIDSWRQRGASAADAAYHGTREVWGAVLASTLTTAVVFVPIVGWQGEVGQLLRDIALAVSLAVGASLVVSVTVIPSMSARLLRGDSSGAKPVLDRSSALGDRLRESIVMQVAWIVGSRRRSLAVSVLGLGLAFGVAIALVPKLEYLPQGNRPLLFGVMITPPGYSLDEVEAIGERVQSSILTLKDGDRDGYPQVKDTFFVGAPSSVFMGARTVDPNRIRDLVPWVQRTLSSEPGSFGIVRQAGLFGRGVGGGRSIDVDLKGDSIEAMVQIGRSMMGALNQALPGAQVRPIPSLDLGNPELGVHPDREALARVGLTVEDLGISVDALLDGRIVADFTGEGVSRADVVLRAHHRSGEELGRAPIATPQGVVALESLATLREGKGPVQIRRLDRARALTLQVSPPDDLPTEAAMERIREQVLAPMRADGRLAPDMPVELAGEAGKLEVAKKRFAGALALAVLVTFLLLAALFEDFRSPLVILVSVPASTAGGVVALRIVDSIYTTGQPLDMMTALGFLMLVGIVVNNAILIVHGALQRERDQGTERIEALIGAVRGRVRPIFMAALTSMAGLMPLVVAGGFGAELYRGVGAVVLGGLALSTLISIYLVPAVYVVIGVGGHGRAAPIL
jgi:HAE1 family hydrophobic/amphiphilic exporter-1